MVECKEHNQGFNVKLAQYTVEEEHAIQTYSFVYTRFYSRNKYVPNNNQETSLKTYTHIFSLEVKMVEIMTYLNWK